MEGKYYRVIVCCGHVGAKKSIEITRYFEGNNIVECYEDAIYMPRSKKKPGCIKEIFEIGSNEYIEGKENEKNNLYLNTFKKYH